MFSANFFGHEKYYFNLYKGFFIGKKIKWVALARFRREEKSESGDFYDQFHHYEGSPASSSRDLNFSSTQLVFFIQPPIYHSTNPWRTTIFFLNLNLKTG
jgi:hypothetical protein